MFYNIISNLFHIIYTIGICVKLDFEHNFLKNIQIFKKVQSLVIIEIAVKQSAYYTQKSRLQSTENDCSAYV